MSEQGSQETQVRVLLARKRAEFDRNLREHEMRIRSAARKNDGRRRAARAGRNDSNAGQMVPGSGETAVPSTAPAAPGASVHSPVRFSTDSDTVAQKPSSQALATAARAQDIVRLLSDHRAAIVDSDDAGSDAVRSGGPADDDIDAKIARMVQQSQAVMRRADTVLHRPEAAAAAVSRASVSAAPVSTEPVSDASVSAQGDPAGADAAAVVVNWESDDSDGGGEVVETVYNGVARRLQHLQALVDAEKRRVAELEAQLLQAREQERAAIHQSREEQNNALAALAAQHEEKLARNLELADRLLADKTMLTQQLEEMSQRMAAAAEASAAAAEEAGRKHAAELARVRDKAVASERARRETWVKEESARIKELTIKGLEPRIAEMLQQHKAELAQVKQQYQARISELEADAVPATPPPPPADLGALPQSPKREKELQARAQVLEQRLADEHHAHQLELQRAEDAATARLDSLARTHADALAQLQARHADTEARLRAEHAQERADWNAAQDERMRQAVEREVAAARAQARAARDAQLETVIERLEQETAEQEQLLLRQHREELAGMRRACDAKVAEVRAELDEWKRKYAVVVKERNQLDAACVAARHENEQLQSDLKVSESRISVIEADRSRLGSQVEQHQSDVELALGRAQQQVAEMKSRLDAERDETAARIKRLGEEQEQRDHQHEMELAQLQKQVVATLAGKDAQIDKLRRRLHDTEAKVQDFNKLVAG